MSAIESLMGPQLEQARERRIFGVVLARVTDIDGDGRYHVEYLSMGDGERSAAARMMVPMAGENRGMHFLPEIGDEVVVAFEHGDVSYPVILGSVWNRNSPPPDTADRSPTNNTRTFVSRSGHELTFDDSAAAEKVTLRSQSGHLIELDDAPGRGRISITTAAGNSIELDDSPSGGITMRTATGSSISMNSAGGDVSMESPTMLTLRATTIRLEAPAGIQLQTTGTPQGSLVLIDNSLYGTHTHTVVVAPTGITAGPPLII